ncbi:protein asteroid-like [Anthonomus grandis grandis]|uniref:protein asteroid-like n=1 Tax=Anthonomus grandis grandis TaxID=2921223 RepID=UPI0021662CA4|nr:protein asteroid-like [Anthonomus grandis grandis]
MGIQGFTKFVNDRSHLFYENYELRDTTLIIDGHSISCQLYNWKQWQFDARSYNSYGGDYDKYAYIVENFFMMLLEVRVKPIVIFDGGFEQRKLPTILKRMQDKINIADRLNPKLELRQPNKVVFPLALRETFKDVLRNMDIPMVMCEYEGDQEIASLAKALNCPVLTFDSDYFIFGVQYIPFRTVNSKVSAIENWRTGIYKCITCKIYKIDKFLDHFKGLQRGTLQLLPVLLGNDYIDFKIFSHFLNSIRATANKDMLGKIEAVLDWLRCETPESAIKKILGSFKNTKERLFILNKIEKIVTSYYYVETHLFKYLHVGSHKEKNYDKIQFSDLREEVENGAGYIENGTYSPKSITEQVQESVIHDNILNDNSASVNMESIKKEAEEEPEFTPNEQSDALLEPKIEAPDPECDENDVVMDEGLIKVDVPDCSIIKEENKSKTQSLNNDILIVKQEAQDESLDNTKEEHKKVLCNPSDSVTAEPLNLQQTSSNQTDSLRSDLSKEESTKNGTHGITLENGEVEPENDSEDAKMETQDNIEEEEKATEEEDLIDTFSFEETHLEKDNTSKNPVSKLFFKNFMKCYYPSSFMDILTQDVYYCIPQVENHAEEVSHKFSFGILRAIHRILTKGQEAEFTIVGRGEGSNVKWFKQEKYHLSLPSIEDIEELTLQGRRDVFLQILGINNNFITLLENFPTEWHTFLLSLKFAASKITFDTPLIYSLILGFIILNYIDHRIGFYRSVERYKQKYFSYMQALPPSYERVAFRADKNCFYYFPSVDCIVFMQKVVHMFTLNPKENVTSYNKNVVHQIAQIQSVLLHVKYLNALLKFPYTNLVPHQIIDSTFIYNLTKTFKEKSSELENTYLNVFFKDCPSILSALKYVLNMINKQIIL